jgi:uncharacterized FlaG/YvyC family protein
MDVQAASGVATAPPLPPIAFPGGTDPSAAPTPTDGLGTSSAIAATAATSPATSSSNGNSSNKDAASYDETLKPLVAKLYNAAEQNVEVSFQVAKGLGEVVTVFTDKTTGKVIVQFPSEQLVALAQFFQKLAGSILDAKA